MLYAALEFAALSSGHGSYKKECVKNWLMKWFIWSDECIKVYHLYDFFLDFSSVLPEVEKAINEADFFCVDTEFSGRYKFTKNYKSIHSADFNSGLREVSFIPFPCGLTTL